MVVRSQHLHMRWSAGCQGILSEQQLPEYLCSSLLEVVNAYLSRACSNCQALCLSRVADVRDPECARVCVVFVCVHVCVCVCTCVCLCVVFVCA